MLEPLYQVRPARLEDVTQIIAAIGALLGELRGTTDTSLPTGAEITCARIIDGRAIGAIFVAYLPAEQASLIGVIALTIQEAIHVGGPYVLIQDLLVHPHYRSHRVGAGLIGAAETYCRERKLTNLEVCLPRHHFPNLPRTYHFYESCGFAEIGPRMRKEIQ